MPVLLARRKPDHIAGRDPLNRTALALHPTAADSDNEGLAKRMGMPCGSSTGSKVTLPPDVRAQQRCEDGRSRRTWLGGINGQGKLL